MTDDTALLRRYLEDRSQAAFRELVERHVHLVYSAALRQMDGDAPRAEDVTQSVFVLLARKATALADRPVIAGWLHTATRNVARETLRRERRRRRREAEAQSMQETSEIVPDWEQLKPVIDDALAELDERDREAILRRYLRGQRFAEIGAALQLTEDAARMRVDRALERLRLVLARRGITSTSAALALALPQGVIAAPVGLAAKASAAALARAAAAAFDVWSALGTPKAVIGISTTVAVVAVGVGLLQFGSIRRLDAAVLREHSEFRDQVRHAEDRVAALETRAPSVAAARLAEPASAVSPASGPVLPMRFASPSLPAPSPEAVARVAAALPLGTTTHLACVLDTSGSMRDPASGSLRTSVVEQLWAILVAYPQIRHVQILDADGRFILGRAGAWIANEGVTREVIQRALASYQIFSNSDPVPGIVRAMRNLPDPEDPGRVMSVVVLGDEITGDEEAAVTRLDRANPVDAVGRRRFSVNAVGFAAHLPESMRAPNGTTATNFARAMQRITGEHGGAFVEGP